MHSGLLTLVTMTTLAIYSTAHAANKVQILEAVKDQKGHLIVVFETETGPKGYYGDSKNLYELSSSLTGSMGPDHNQLEIYEPRLEKMNHSQARDKANSNVYFGMTPDWKNTSDNSVQCGKSSFPLTRVSDSEVHQLEDSVIRGQTQLVELPNDTYGNLYERAVRTGIDSYRHEFIYRQWLRYHFGGVSLYIGEPNKMVHENLAESNGYGSKLPDGSYLRIFKQEAVIVSPNGDEVKYALVDLSNFDVKWLGIPGVPQKQSDLRTPCEDYLPPL